jgi:hypothetical protein
MTSRAIICPVCKALLTVKGLDAIVHENSKIKSLVTNGRVLIGKQPVSRAVKRRRNINVEWKEFREDFKELFPGVDYALFLNRDALQRYEQIDDPKGRQRFLRTKRLQIIRNFAIESSKSK